MAKRKKLNKRVVILLVAFGVVIAAAVVWRGLLALPKDPVASASAGDQALQEGKAALEKNDYQEAGRKFGIAARKFSEAAAADEKNPDYPCKLADTHWTWVRVRTITETARVEHGGMAHEWLTKALRRKPDHIPSLELMCEVKWHGGFGALGFIETVDKLLAAKPNDDKNYYRRAMAKASLIAADRKYVDQAYSDYKRTTELKPDEVTYWYGLVTFLREHMPAKLDETFKLAIEKNPKSASLHVGCGEYLLSRWEEVQDRKQTGRLKAGEGEEEQAAEWHKQARKLFETAKSCEPANPVGRIAMGRLYIVDKDMENARKELEAARAMDERAYNAHRLLSGVYDKLGQRELAIEATRKALATMPPVPDEGARNPQDREYRDRFLEDKKLLNFNLANYLIGKTGTAPAAEKEKLLDEARKCVADIQRVDSKSPLRPLLAARIAVAEGKGEQAMEILEQARKDGTADERAIDLLISIYFDYFPGKAEELLAYFPENPVAELMKAMFEIRYRRYERAAERVKRILATSKDTLGAADADMALSVLIDKANRLPAELKLVGRNGEVLSTALLNKSDQMWVAGRRNDATSLLQDLHAKLPGEKEIVRRLVTAYRLQNQPAKVDDLLGRLRITHQGDAVWQRFLGSLAITDPEQRFAFALEEAKAQKEPLVRAMTMASVCRAHGKDKLFRQYVEEAAKIKPDEPQVVAWQFEEALEQRPVDSTTAEKCVELATKANLDSVGGRFFKVRLFVARGRYPEAISILRDILTEHPMSNRERLLLGSCYAAAGQLAKAEETFAAIAKADPTNAQAAIRMAAVMEIARNEQGFVEWVGIAQQLAPSDPAVLTWKLMIDERKARDDQLAPYITARERKQAADPSDLQNIQQLAVLYHRASQFSKAESLYRLYYDKSADKQGAAIALGKFYVSRRRYGDVDALMQRLLTQASDDAGKSIAYVVYGSLLHAYNKPQALNAYDQAIKVDADNANAYLAKADCLAGQNQLKEAAGVLAEFTKRLPTNVYVRKQLARYYMDLRDMNAAATELEGVLKVSPEDMEALMLRGSVAYEQADRQRALQFFSRVLQIGPGNLEALRVRAQTYFLLRKDEQAKEDLRVAAKVATNREQMIRLAGTWMEFGEFDEALRLYAVVLENNPGYEPAIRGVIQVYIEKKDWSTVKMLLADARKRFPSDEYYLNVQAAVHRQLVEPAEEIAALAEAFKVAPNSLAVLINYMDGLIRANRVAEALAVSKDYVDKPGYEVWLPAIRARATAKLNNTSEADSLFVSALKDADNTQLATVVADMRDAYGDKQAAVKLTEWADKYRPKDPLVLLHLGALRAATKDIEGAIKAFEEARDLTDQADLKADAWTRIGTVYYTANKEINKAEQAYLAALKLKPDHTTAMNNLAYLYVDRLGQPDKAIFYSEKAIAIMPRNGLVLDTYGWAMAKLGRYEQAQAVLEDAARMTRGHSAIHYHLGWLHEKTGRLKDAVEHYRLAKELTSREDPIYQSISDALDRIKAAQEPGRGK